MYSAIRKTGRFFRKSLSLVLAFSMMISVCLVSGFSIGASAATSAGQKFDINLSQNSTWKNLTSLNVRFAKADGTILSSKENVTKSNGVFQVTAPAGATQIEISSAPFSLSGTKAVASGYRRIVLKNPVNGTTYSTPYVHYYGGDSSHSSTTWPGTKMTELGNGYYYCDIHSSYSTLNFSDNGNTSKQTADLSIEKSYSDNVSYYNGSSWTNPFVKTIDISSASSNSEVEIYLQSNGTFQESKYLSTLADQSANQNITFATVFVINENWNSLSSVYATYDYNDPYRAVVKLEKDTYNGVTVFKGKIPKDALLKFHPQASTTTGASEPTSYKTFSDGDSTGYSDNTSTYKITSTTEIWGKFSEINKINYDATVTDRFSKSSNIIGVEATYYDYLSDNERSYGYLNNATNSYADGNGMWFPFTDFNKYISSIASANSGWAYPLYFGNLYKEGNQYGYSSEVSGLTRYYDGDYRYAVNNSNGLSNYNQSIQGLAYSKLDSDGDIQVVNGVKMPYFDTDTLSAAQYSNSRVAKVFKSSFPFRSSTNSSGVTTYSFNSKNATDNVYFTWDGTTPKYVNYGAGSTYGVMDAAKAFGNSADGYGIFPFNNNSAQKSQTIEENSDALPNVSSDQFYIQSNATNYYMYLFEGSSASKHITLSNKTTVNGVSYFVVNKSDVDGYAKCIFKPNSGENWTGQTGNLTIANLFGGVWKTDGTAYTSASSKTYTRGGNDNLDFGFGVRLDIDFRVPENGTVDGTVGGEAVKFDYSGDDDLWVYIGTDPTGADADLVLDLGGDHKEATGSINFKTMTATANDVYADYSTSSSSEISVPSDEIWVKTDSSYADFCLHVWQDTSVGTLNDGAYFVKPYATSDGFYKFKKSQLGSNTAVDFEKYMNTGGKLAYIADLSGYYGKAWNGDGSAYTGSASGNTNLGAVTKTFNNGVQLDPNTTYHMVVFYMERGLAESNFSVEFTMTPANNDLKVNKTLDTGDVISEIANDLRENETYTYSIKDKNGTGDSSGKAYTINDGSDLYLENSSFKLKDSDTAD
ncbi:MAG: starch-binding protein, partial [Ruminococcus sp.]